MHRDGYPERSRARKGREVRRVRVRVRVPVERVLASCDVDPNDRARWALLLGLLPLGLLVVLVVMVLLLSMVLPLLLLLLPLLRSLLLLLLLPVLLHIRSGKVDD
jgi:hypothetical protein